MNNVFDTITPAVEVPGTTNTSTTTAQQTTTETTSTVTSVYLPSDYLSNGYFATTDKGAKYLRPEFVGEYAEIMANLLEDMKSSDFNRLLREMKRSKSRALPFEARQTAAAEMLPKALALVYRKKAPALLISFIKHNLNNIHDDDDWNAFYRHLEAIAGYRFKSVAEEGGDT